MLAKKVGGARAPSAPLVPTPIAVLERLHVTRCRALAGPRASVETRYGAGQISRDPRTKRHQTRRERLARASKLTVV